MFSGQIGGQKNKRDMILRSLYDCGIQIRNCGPEVVITTWLSVALACLVQSQVHAHPAPPISLSSDERPLPQAHWIVIWRDRKQPIGNREAPQSSCAQRLHSPT